MPYNDYHNVYRNSLYGNAYYESYDENEGEKKLSTIFTDKLFAIVISLFAYWLGHKIQKRWKSPLLNPLLLAIIFIIAFLCVFKIPLASYKNGGDVISMFLAPATAVLAYSIYHQLGLLKKNWVPILIGCITGALSSMISVFILCRIFHLDHQLMVSLIPKSVTTPIAMGISGNLGGIVSVTVAAVVVTGIFGSVITPILVKILKLKNKVAIGVAIGSCSHAVGTSKAIEMGEKEGAMSGIAIGICGIVTVLLSLFL